MDELESVYYKQNVQNYTHIMCYRDSENKMNDSECIKYFCWLEFGSADNPITWTCDRQTIRKSEIAKLKD